MSPQPINYTHSTPPSTPRSYRCRYFPMTLSQSDIDALKPGEWVTDNVIDFYFRFLKHRYFVENKKYVYIPVPLASLLTVREIDSSSQNLQDLSNDANSMDSETQCLRRPKSIRVAFIPIFGDGHWSLLVYRNEKHRLAEFLHFNSYLGSTREQHTECARSAVINLLYVFRQNDPSMTISKDTYKLVVKNCPQQTNSNDCGIFVCMFAYILSSRLNLQEKEKRASSIHEFVKRMSAISIGNNGDRSNSGNGSRRGSSATRTPHQQLSFASKDPNKDNRHSVAKDQALWKIKDKDSLAPDYMREYIANVIYHASGKSSRHTTPSASL